MTKNSDSQADQAPALDDRRGTLGLGPDGEWQIRFERRLAHSPERVWAALTEPGQQARWLPGVTIEPEVGGSAVFDFGDEGRAAGEVTEVEPRRHLVHTWIWPGEPVSTVRWEIFSDGDGTVLTLLQRPLRPEPAVSFCTGWHAMLDSLDVHLDGGNPSDLEPDYGLLFDIYSKVATESS
ncbi:SRPBCC family protein [Phytoactinopolyspora limicola]|uniref:SRPBCC family protein n=1 Tax=Phytoactinopolyspora limicola TaxID=2715536 RepID=UPI0014088E88|nr:SRPBCC family protein [Phytoactinopolyspora limicola]